MIQERNAIEEILELPPGSLVTLYTWGAAGAGTLGTWLVGRTHLWDVEDIVGKGATRQRHPSRLHTETIVRWTRRGAFRSLGRKKRENVLAMLRQKTAEKGTLAPLLRRQR